MAETKKVICETRDETIHGTVDIDTDLCGRFLLTCDDTGEVINVNGWAVDTREVFDDIEIDIDNLMNTDDMMGREWN